MKKQIFWEVVWCVGKTTFWDIGAGEIYRRSLEDMIVREDIVVKEDEDIEPLLGKMNLKRKKAEVVEVELSQKTEATCSRHWVEGSEEFPLEGLLLQLLQLVVDKRRVEGACALARTAEKSDVQEALGWLVG